MGGASPSWQWAGFTWTGHLSITAVTHTDMGLFDPGPRSPLLGLNQGAVNLPRAENFGNFSVRGSGSFGQSQAKSFPSVSSLYAKLSSCCAEDVRGTNLNMELSLSLSAERRSSCRSWSTVAGQSSQEVSGRGQRSDRPTTSWSLSAG